MTPAAIEQGTVLRIRVERLKVYASNQPGAGRESTKTVTVREVFANGRYYVRIHGKPLESAYARLNLDGEMTGFGSSCGKRPFRYLVLSHEVVSLGDSR